MATPLPSKQVLLTDAQRLAWLRLIRSQNVGPITFVELINFYGSAERALDALPELSAKGMNGKKIRISPKDVAERELDDAARAGASLIAMGEPGYPSRLTQIYSPPPLLYLKGNTHLTERPIIAIVGARNGSALGQKFTKIIATDLAQQNFVIASGLARGIDRAAHEASLRSGTIASLAGGIAHFYPSENTELQKEIAEKGLLISEQPPHFLPRAQDFPRRNRIISGISLAVVVVEAAQRSGSLITARLANEQNREVFAVPGHPLDPRAKGTNSLIKNGATPITSANDILEVITPILCAPRSVENTIFQDPCEEPPFPDAVSSKTRSDIVSAIGPTPIDIDEIVRATGHTVSEVRIVLLELDLAGSLTRDGHQRVSLNI